MNSDKVPKGKILVGMKKNEMNLTIRMLICLAVSFSEISYRFKGNCFPSIERV